MKKPYKKKKLGGYPAIGVVISITLALFVIGLFGMLIIYSQQLEKVVRENVRLQVYLKANLTETQRLQIENKLLSMDFVAYQGSRESIAYVSKEEAAKKFIEETGEDFKQFIGDNPLKDAFLINVDPAYHSKQQMEKVKREIQKMNGVFQVFYVEGLIDSINQNVTKIALILLGMVVVLFITVILLINNTLRLALFSQRFLIRSMQLVGAKRWFILQPFLLRSAGYGLLSGLIAAALLWALTNYANTKIEDLVLLQNQNQIIILSGVLLALGVTVAVSSTLLSINKYLRMSLDELY